MRTIDVKQTLRSVSMLAHLTGRASSQCAGQEDAAQGELLMIVYFEAPGDR